jgi:hypothetical protein
MLQSWMFMRSTLTTSSLPFGSTYLAFWQPLPSRRADAASSAETAVGMRVAEWMAVEWRMEGRKRRE